MAINYLYIVPPSPIFNLDRVPVFENLSGEDSSMLYSTLYLNHVELFNSVKNSLQLYLCLDEIDKEVIPSILIDDPRKIFMQTEFYQADLIKNLSTLLVQNSANVILIPSNSIGLTPPVLERAFNLLNYEDNNIIIGRSSNNNLSFIGLNYFDENFLLHSDLITSDYETILKASCQAECFPFYLEGSLVIKNINDFRELYKILSTKQSIEFCSHEKHELFTHLFVEYKEML